MQPFVTWGTNPGQGVPLDGRVPDPAGFSDSADAAAAQRALDYMALKAGTAMASMAKAPIAIPAICLFRNVRGDLLIFSLPLFVSCLAQRSRVCTRTCAAPAFAKARPFKPRGEVKISSTQHSPMTDRCNCRSISDYFMDGALGL